MSDTKPSSVAEYKRWLSNTQKCDCERIQPYYETVTSKIRADFEASALWRDLIGQRREFNDQYLVKTGFPLLMSAQTPELLIKPFDSLVLKTYRQNVLRNDHWPEEPARGWVLPSTCFSSINDILRTSLIVKYLDGVEFLVERLESLCQSHALGCHRFFEARQEGYYAAHLYVKHSFEIPQLSWDTEVVEMSVEIQITTQLQETIRSLLHKYYEARRQQLRKTGAPWQWEYNSDEFAANYLGHILHYVEGMIMEVREKQKRGAS